MSHTSLPLANCPSGFDPCRVAALVEDGSDFEARAHVHACAVCTDAYLDHIVIDQVVRDVAADRFARARPPRRHRPIAGALWIRAWPVAAALLIGIGGLAGAAAHRLLVPHLVSTQGAGLGFVGEMEVRTGLDFRAAGVPAGAKVVAWTSYVAGDAELGTAVVLERGGDRRVDVLAFRGDGSVAWTARDRWPDEALALLGYRYARFSRLVSVARRRDGDRVREMLVVALETAREGAVLTVDPVSGKFLGALVHDGRFSRDTDEINSINVLPGPDGEDRSLALFAQHRESTTSQLCMVVLKPDCSITQHIVFPTLGIRGADGPVVRGAFIDWNREHRGVEFMTTDRIVFALPVRRGRLDLDDVTARTADGLRAVYEGVRGAGSFDRLVDPEGDGRGSMETLQEQLQSAVEERPITRRTAWEMR